MVSESWIEFRDKARAAASAVGDIPINAPGAAAAIPRNIVSPHPDPGTAAPVNFPPRCSYATETRTRGWSDR
jgi:hypothetical protein